MHALAVLKKVALAAISDPDDEEATDPAALSLFHAVCDPQTVYELCERVERLEAEIAWLRAQSGH